VGVFQNHLMAAAAASTATAADFYEYQIANSIRFDGSTSVLTKTWGSDATNNDKWAISVWVKGHKTDGTWEIIASCAQSVLMALGVGARYDSDAHAIMYYTGNGGNNAQSLARGRDTSAWRHIVMIYDSSQSTGADRIKIYNNGEHWTAGSTTYWGDIDGNGYPSQDTDSGWGMNGNANEIGRYQYNGDADYSGYMADFISIDGAASISDFGETKDGVWVPKDPSGLTFGNNGFWLNFASSGDLGNDVSGNNNDWTTAGLAASDQMLDSPTFDGTDNGGNFPTLNPLFKHENITFSEGNLKHSTSTNQRGVMCNIQIPKTGKWYWEHLSVAFNYPTDHELHSVGVNVPTVDIDASRGGRSTGISYASNNGQKYVESGTGATYGDAWEEGDIVGVEFDADNGTINFSKNGTFQGDISLTSAQQAKDWFPFVGMGGGTSTEQGIFNFGQDGTFAGEKTAQGIADENGYCNFYYSPPSGAVALCAANLPTPAADPASEKGPAKYFINKLYTGDGASTLAITGLEFQPDFTWIKNRDQADDHCLFDSTRGVTKLITSNSEAAETTDADTLKSWTSDGFTVGADVKVNTSSEKYVSWNWKANGGTTSSNSDGSITSTVQVDADRGFSIIKYTGSGSGAITYGHGLSAAPEFIVNWRLEASQSRTVYHHLMNDGGAPADQGRIYLDATSTYDTGSGGLWDVSAITSSTIGCVSGTWMNQSEDFLTLAFVGKEGFSKFSYYKGNGNADGTFVYTGFRPAYVMIKSTDVADSWFILDDVRDIYNEAEEYLQANSSAEGLNHSNIGIDILSNGFKCRRSSNALNGDGNDYVYVAFAKNPFKYATAR
jgi:hypothetical protein